MKKRHFQKCRKAAAFMLAFTMMLASVLQLGMGVTAAQRSAQSGLTITESDGWFESAYAEWNAVQGATGYKAYVKEASASDSAYTQLDNELIREYPDYWRADALGLKAGSYILKIEAVLESGSVYAQTSEINVLANDRSGYGFVNGTSSGAYNDDGTLKSNAVVLYITEENKDDISLEVTGATSNPCVGIQAIINAFKKGKDSRPLCVRFIGNITDMAVMDKGDIVIDGCINGITFEGVGEDATINGFGIRIKNSSNVELRNLAFMNCDSSEGDDVGLQQKNNHVWVHNCDFFYGHAGSDADQVKGDGALDTKTSTYITHSYNHFYDTGKSNLQGMKSESTENYITYHHNWYDHSDSRHPRIRTCTVHVYNNYYDGNAKYGIGATMGCSVFAENNYFRNCKYPMLMAGQGSDILYSDTASGTFSGENGGVIKAYGNHIEGAKSAVTQNESADQFDFYAASSRDEVINCTATKGGSKYSNFDTASGFYSYTVQSAEEAKETVVNYAGRMNGGDFEWTFDNSVDDESYVVNEALKSKLMSYTSQLKSVGGMDGVSGDGSEEKPTEKPTEGTTEAPTEKPTEQPTEKPTETPDVPSTSETVTHNFTEQGKTSSYFVINGNLSSSKGTVNYNGLTLTQCLKIESSTSITFTMQTEGTLTLVFNSDFSKNISIDGQKLAAANGVLTVDLQAGSHEIKKADTANLYYISVTGQDDSGEEPSEPDEKPTVPEEKPDNPDTGSTGAPEYKDGDIYVSVNGTSEAAGTLKDPMDLLTAINTVKAGNTIWMLSGTYYAYEMYNAPIIIDENNSGNAFGYKTISSVNGETVTIDFEGMAEEGSNRGITLDGSYWHFYDIDICNAGDNGMLLSGDYNIIELCQFYNNHDTGLQLSRYNTSYNSIEQWPSYNTILNCTAYNNKDLATCENADGFAAKLTCGEGNVFDGCISYCNSDDGWDLYAKPATGPIGVVTIKNCVAFGNGKLTDGTGSANGDMNGFKLGGSNGACPTPHVVENCLAFNNGATGFTDNGNGGAVKLTNCTAVNNGKYDSNKANFMCYRTSADAEYTNILSVAASSSSATDQFKGKLSHVLYNYKAQGYYWVNQWTCTDGAKTKYTGSEARDNTVSSSDFVSTEIPGYNASTGAYTADYHEIFRNDDGSVNLGGLFELKTTSSLYIAGENGGYIGSSFAD